MARPEKHYIEISVGTIVKSILFVLLVIGLYYIRNVVAMILFSVIIASAIEPAANWFVNRRIPRVLAVVFIYIAMFAIFGMLFYMIIPTFASEMGTFAKAFPEYLRNPKYFQSLFSSLPFTDGSFSSILEQTLGLLQDKITFFASGFFGMAAQAVGGFIYFILAVVLSFYLAVQKNGLENFLRIVSPPEYEDYVLKLWQRVRRKIGLWAQGQILLGILVGILVFLGLSILRVEYALVFAILAAIFELIPIFGPILSAIPPVVVAFLQDPPLALVVVALYVVIQQFESHLIYPLVVKKIVGVPPVLVILSMIIGGQLAGFVGVILSVPVATALLEFLNDVAAKKNPVPK